MERMRSTAILICAAVLVVGGCTAQKAPRSAAPATTPTTQPAGLDGCVQPGSAELVEVGGGVHAAVLGTGPAGVVLSNQSDQNLCGWLPFAKTLAARGFRVLVYDYGTAADPAGDVVNAAAKLRALGVRTVLLAGASRGANASLLAAPGIRPPVAGVVTLSAEARTAQGQDVVAFAAKLKAPVLFITAEYDPYGAADAAPRFYRAASKAPSRRLEVVAGDAHGTALLAGPNGAKVQAMIIDFLSKHDQAS
jgi:pimeloyl-ACP methyl ester carboxylesterase